MFVQLSTHLLVLFLLNSTAPEEEKEGEEDWMKKYVTWVVSCFHRHYFIVTEYPCLSPLLFSAGESEEDEDEDEEPVEPVPMGLGDKFKGCWAARKVNLDHDYAIAGWALCVMPEVMADVKKRMNGSHRLAIERVVERLHLAPCPNPKVDLSKMTVADIVDQFWNEWDHFSEKTGPFEKKARWMADDVTRGKSFAWHKKYSLHSTMFLGWVACRVTSKHLGVGSAERVWANTKDIKAGKLVNRSSANTEMRAILCTSARIQEARIRQDLLEAATPSRASEMFSDDDIK